MPSEHWRKVDELYHAVRECASGERSAFLSKACGDDAELRREIESLLGNDISGDSCLDRPRWTDPRFTMTLSDPAAGTATAKLPEYIGDYLILRLIGEGGMGAVYEAEQQQPRRIVALKVIKPGSISPERLRRFELESQALGRLQHPGIAQIFEAGTAETGFGTQPYFAMEFIHGETLREYVQTHEVNTRERLELMAKVTDAVQHAHQRGLIHRDLKPGNILVDETGQPKILDFGVARATDGDTQATRQTDLGELVGTLAYMSPEQVLADPLELDTRSDVYALGVILYELLAGRLPYTISKKLHEAVQTIREEDPARLSSVRRAYRGDIETIVAKALEKDKGRRYASAADLAADIRRYLNHEPIAARPASTTYQIRKFAGRHKPVVFGLAAVFAVLIVGIAVSAHEALRARQAEQTAVAARDGAASAEQNAITERDRAISAERSANEQRAQATQERNHAVAEQRRADTEAANAKAVNDFLQNDLLGQASSTEQAKLNNRPDPDIKVRTALDRAAARVESKFGAQPLVEASIRHTIGLAYRDLGVYPEAQRHLERALELRKHILGNEHPDTLIAMSDVANVYRDEGKYTEAELLNVKALAVRQRVSGPEHNETLVLMNELALVYNYEGKSRQAEELFTKLVAIRRRVSGNESPETLTSMYNLADTYKRLDKYEPAENLMTEVLNARRRILGSEHPRTLNAMNALASVYLNERKYAQAEPLYLAAIETGSRVLGKDHPDVLGFKNNLAIIYVNTHRPREAEPLCLSILEDDRRELGESHPETLTAISNLAILYSSEGEYAKAEPLLAKVLEDRKRVLGEEHPRTLESIYNLASVYIKTSQYARAEEMLSHLLETSRRALGEKHTLALRTSGALGYARLLQHKYTEAEPPLREAVRLYDSGARDVYEKYEVQSLLGASLAGQKRYVEAEPLLLSGYEGMVRLAGTFRDSPSSLREAGKAIVQFYSDSGNTGQATAWLKRLTGDGVATRSSSTAAGYARRVRDDN